MLSDGEGQRGLFNELLGLRWVSWLQVFSLMSAIRLVLSCLCKQLGPNDPWVWKDSKLWHICRQNNRDGGEGVLWTPGQRKVHIHVKERIQSREKVIPIHMCMQGWTLIKRMCQDHMDYGLTEQCDSKNFTGQWQSCVPSDFSCLWEVCLRAWDPSSQGNHSVMSLWGWFTSGNSIEKAPALTLTTSHAVCVCLCAQLASVFVWV